ncbi:MAG: hypothetical protein ACPL4E_04680 [Thermoproteota archaeon]
MACFLVPMTVAIFTSLFRRRVPKTLMINVLNLLLWGGVLGLAVEHVAHGEVVPYPPFLTAGIEHVIPEMVTIGIPMTISVSGVWGLIVLTVNSPPGKSLRISRLGIASVSQTKKRAR